MSGEANRNTIYYGTAEGAPELHPLRAGPLTLVLEGGDLRYISLGGQEIVRRLYVAVRDRDWNTIPPRYSNLRVSAAEHAFEVSFDVEHVAGEVDFAWQGLIRGSANGTITYSLDGQARSTFIRQRIGFCVLHPMALAGQPCTVTTTDGSRRQTAFPQHIAPQQPFLDVRAITHQVAPGVRATVEMTGDVFESEDQRNWTDASYKTYSTPLSLPHPVPIEQGARVRQAVTISLEGTATSVAAPEQGPVTITIDPAATAPLPALGLGMASHGMALTTGERDRLRALRLAHLRADLDLSGPYEAALGRATEEANALAVPLEVALLLSDDPAAQLAGLRAALRRLQPPVVRWLVFKGGEASTGAQWVRQARLALGDYAPAAPFGGGTNSYFVEINRQRPPIEVLDLVSYAITPQVHAFDTLSLVENLEAQRETLRSARAFCGNRPLAISPVTLRPRFNPDATGPEPAPAPGELPASVDPRQLSLFGAAWTVGSIAYLAQGGAASVTYHETTGWRGVLETAAGSPLPRRFPSTPGMTYPLYHVLADVGELGAGSAVLRSGSSNPLRAVGLALRGGGQLRVLLANMTAATLETRVVGMPRGTARVRHLDEGSYAEATTNPERFRATQGDEQAVQAGALAVTLRPYCVACVEASEGG